MQLAREVPGPLLFGKGDVSMLSAVESVVIDVIGHRTPQTTLTTYSHYFQEARNKVRNAIADVLLDKTDDEKAAV